MNETTGSATAPAALATVELTEAALTSAAQVVPDGSPVVMVDLLRFREVADYGGDAERGAVPAGASGRAAYLDGCVPAFSQIAEQEGVETEIAFYGQVHASLVAPATERWDDVAGTLSLLYQPSDPTAAAGSVRRAARPPPTATLRSCPARQRA